jgi:hypothetical protein
VTTISALMSVTSIWWEDWNDENRITRSKSVGRKGKIGIDGEEGKVVMDNERQMGITHFSPITFKSVTTS